MWKHENLQRLYKHVFHPDYHGLAFVGLTNIPDGPFPLAAEMQAIWIASVIKGSKQLPPQTQMQKVINKQLRQNKPTVSMNLIPLQHINYMNELAKEIGVMPRLWKKPRFFWHFLTKPLTPDQFRLDRQRI